MLKRNIILLLLIALSFIHLSSSQPTQDEEDPYSLPSEYYTTAGVLISVFAILFGFFLAFLGYRLYYLYLFAAGFVAAGGLTLILIVSYTISDSLSKIVLSLVIGSIAGFFTLLIHSLGYAVAGVILALFIAGIVAMVVHKAIIIVIISITLSILLAAFAMFFPKTGIIVCSSVIGSYGVVGGIDFLSRSQGGLIYIYLNLFKLKDMDDWPNWLTWFLLGVLGILALLSVFVQARFTGKKYQHIPLITFQGVDEYEFDEEDYFSDDDEPYRIKSSKKKSKKDKKKKKKRIGYDEDGDLLDD